MKKDEEEYTEFVDKILVDTDRAIMFFDHLNDRDCWLPKYYRDGRPMIRIEELRHGVEITMPMWLAYEKELI